MRTYCVAQNILNQLYSNRNLKKRKKENFKSVAQGGKTHNTEDKEKEIPTCVQPFIHVLM